MFRFLKALFGSKKNSLSLKQKGSLSVGQKNPVKPIKNIKKPLVIYPFTATQYLKTKDFSINLKNAWYKKFEEVHGSKKLSKAIKERQVLDPVKLNDDDVPTTFIGVWSSGFLRLCIDKKDSENFQDQSLWSWKQMDIVEIRKYLRDFPNNSEVPCKYIFHSIWTTIAHLQNVTGINYFEDDNWKVWNFLSERAGIFQNVIDYFKNQVFVHVKDLQDEKMFNKFNEIQRGSCISVNGKEYRCLVDVWKFDFIQNTSMSLVDLRFSKSKFVSHYLWQSLLYMFLINHHYNKEMKSFKTFNTRTGIEYSTTLGDLFGKDGYEWFMDTCYARLFCSDKNWPQELTRHG